MSKEEFDAYYAALDKGSDRARSVIYVFIIVFTAILFYMLNSFVYPSRQYTFDTIREIASCRYDAQDRDLCAQDLGLATLQHLNLPPKLIDQIEQGLWQHELTLSYDDSVALRTFQFPIFGITTDRDLIWVIFPFIGILGYYIVWLSLAKVVTMFNHILAGNSADPVRLRLILSTQVLTAPMNNENAEVGGIFRPIWMAISVSVFFVPVITGAVALLDQVNGLAVLREAAGAQFVFNWTPGFVTRFVLEAVMLLFQILLLTELIRVARRFGRDQERAQALIAAAEA
jgi:hypothetical protein